MKKLLFPILLLLSQLSVWAQTKKERWNVSVSVGSLSYQSAEAGSSFSCSLLPSATSRKQSTTNTSPSKLLVYK